MPWEPAPPQGFWLGLLFLFWLIVGPSLLSSAFVLDFLVFLNLLIPVAVCFSFWCKPTSTAKRVLPVIISGTICYQFIVFWSSLIFLVKLGSICEVPTLVGSALFMGGAYLGCASILFLLILQYISIVNGAELMSARACKFTLDAMPGRQMGIDAKLSSGKITEIEVEKIRLAIQVDANFLAKMDQSFALSKINLWCGLILAAGITIFGISSAGVETLVFKSLIGLCLIHALSTLFVAICISVFVTKMVIKMNW